jgi:serine protease Do
MKHLTKVTSTIAVLVVAGLLLGYGPQIASALKDSDPPKSPAIALVPANFKSLAENARPGVVNIRTVKTIKGGGPVMRHFFGNPFGGKNPFDEFFGPFSGGDPRRDFKQRSLGSGFVIDAEGYIVTNNHVIENSDQIKVKLANGKEFDAKVVGRDPKTDLALIKIKENADLVPLPMGDSDTLDVGTWVVAIGSPFGLEQTVTAGIVSAKGRIIGSGPYDDFIQTDASINPGNSGGPLMNMRGEVVGINTAIVAQGQGIGFAIPVNLAREITKQLKTNGEVSRGWLGVGIQNLTPELAEYYGIEEKSGVLVTDVFKGDPADTAGIVAGDVITAVDGETVKTSRDLSMAIANTPVSKRTAISIMREGKQKTVYVTLGKRDDDLAQVTPNIEKSEALGLGIASLKPDNARRFGYEETERGVLITDVKRDSKAEQAGLRSGDLIKEINRKPVETRQEFVKQLAKINPGEPVQLLLKRGNSGYLAANMVK